MNKRKGMTLVEMMVVIVILSLFILIAGNIFQMTFDAYQFNKKTAAQLYAQTNVDNVFYIIEKELLYAGSMGSIIDDLNDPSFYEATPLTISGSDDKARTINSKYALAEKVIVSKKYLDYYDEIKNYDEIFQADEDPTRTYFALFPAEFPEATQTNTKWSVSFDDISNTSDATVINIFNTETVIATLSNDSTSTAVRIYANDTSATPVKAEKMMAYISPFLYEKSLESEAPVELPTKEGTTLWYGEMIYNSIITLEATKLKLEKYIPTIGASYTIVLMDNVTSFEATKTELNSNTFMITATLTYDLPDIKLEVETGGATQVITSRQFLYTNN